MTEIKEFLIAKVAQKLPDDTEVDSTQNLIQSGVFDSLDFINMLMELESKFGLDLDFSDLDPVEFTSIDGLVKNLG